MLNTVQHEIGREHISATCSCKCLMIAVEAPMHPAHWLNAGAGKRVPSNDATDHQTQDAEGDEHDHIGHECSIGIEFSADFQPRSMMTEMPRP
jgi:hypothetical protein